MRTLAGILLVATLIVACAVSNTPYPGTAPNYPYGPSPSPVSENEQTPTQVFAQIRLDTSVERIFSEQDAQACVVDTRTGEAVITFENPQSDSSLSLRLQKVNFQYSQHSIRAGTNQTFLLSIGGDKRKNRYQIADETQSQCVLSYRIVQNAYLTGQIQCQNLLNAQGEYRNANGTFVCRMQSEQNWKW